MKMKRNSKTKTISFIWINCPSNIRDTIIKRMEMLGFNNFREYNRFLIMKDLEEWDKDLYAKDD